MPSSYIIDQCHFKNQIMQVSGNLYSTFKLFLISPHHLVWFPKPLAFRWGPSLPPSRQRQGQSSSSSNNDENKPNCTLCSYYDRSMLLFSRPIRDRDTSAVRRGVRSDVQLSCTEIQFQKCSKSGRNGSKH